MKRSILAVLMVFLFVATAIAFSGCDGGSNPAGPSTPTSSSSIVGSWKRCIGEECRVSTFMADGTYEQRRIQPWDSCKFLGTYTINGDNLKIVLTGWSCGTLQNPGRTSEGKYRVEGNKLWLGDNLFERTDYPG